jgi:hypothetical protein
MLNAKRGMKALAFQFTIHCCGVHRVFGGSLRLSIELLKIMAGRLWQANASCLGVILPVE